MTDRIPPTCDLGFKKTFADPANKDILQGIIGDFFDLRPALDDITVTAPYSVKAYGEYLKRLGGKEMIGEKLRQTIQDIAADIKIAGFGAEIQIQKDAYFSRRSLYYACDRFCSNYNRPGEMLEQPDGTPIRYSSLKPVYTLNILGYPHFPGDDDALRVFTLYDPKRRKAFEMEYLTIAYFELTKDGVETENQRHWRSYFKTGAAPGDAPEYIRKAARVIERTNLTQEERDMIDQLERAEEIYKSTIYTAQIEGEKKGRIEGEKKGRIEGEKKGKVEERMAIARNLLQKDIPIDDIADVTGLSRREIEKLIH